MSDGGGGSGLHPRLEVDKHTARLVLEALRRVEDVGLQRDVVPQDERREDHLHLHDHQAFFFFWFIGSVSDCVIDAQRDDAEVEE